MSHSICSDEVFLYSDCDSESGYTTRSSPLPDGRILRTPPHLIPMFKGRPLRTPSPSKPSLKRRRGKDWLDSDAKRWICEVILNEREDTESCPSRSRTRSISQLKSTEWLMGMPCRALYEDGFAYEAFIVRILDDIRCIIKYLGYDDTKKVDMDTLMPSLGEEAQLKQIDRAFLERGEEDIILNDEMQHKRMQESPCTGSERLYHRRDPRMNRGTQDTSSVYKPKNISPMSIPSPPPPQMQTPNMNGNSLTNMLRAWYMSGYLTCYYQYFGRSSSSASS